MAYAEKNYSFQQLASSFGTDTYTVHYKDIKDIKDSRLEIFKDTKVRESITTTIPDPVTQPVGCWPLPGQFVGSVYPALIAFFLGAILQLRY